jgi:hypothetical protein
MASKSGEKYALLIAVFGFMLIIATGVNMLIGDDSIPPLVSIIGLILIIVAMMLKKRSVQT